MQNKKTLANINMLFNGKNDAIKFVEDYGSMILEAKRKATEGKGLKKVVSATFLLVCFICLKESTFETRKNVFYFTSKALFILEVIIL